MSDIKEVLASGGVEKSSGSTEGSGESVGVESSGSVERSFEVESVIEKLEGRKNAMQQQDAGDDVAGVVAVAGDDQPLVSLPVSQDDIQRGSSMPIISSLRWLAEWAIRQIKKLRGRVMYRKSEVK